MSECKHDFSMSDSILTTICSHCYMTEDEAEIEQLREIADTAASKYLDLAGRYVELAEKYTLLMRKELGEA